MRVADILARVGQIDKCIDLLNADLAAAQSDEGCFGRQQYSRLNERAICETIGLLKEYRNILTFADADVPAHED